MGTVARIASALGLMVGVLALLVEPVAGAVAIFGSAAVWLLADCAEYLRTLVLIGQGDPDGWPQDRVTVGDQVYLASRVPCGCGAMLRQRAEYAGRTVKCPQCDRPIEMPALSKPAPRDEGFGPG